MGKASEPDVSVILPVRDCEKFLACAIESIMGQTLENWELIIVNDGSKDASGEIAREYARRDARVKAADLPAAGLVAALNEGLRVARAPLAARMDADDISLPGRLAAQASLLREKPETGVASCFVRSFPEGEVGEGMLVYEEWLNTLATHEEIARDMFVESPLAHPSVMFRMSDVEAVGGYRDNGWPEDYDLWMRLFLHGTRFEKVREVLYLWRDTPGRLSRTAKQYSVVAFRKLRMNYLLKSYLAGRGEVSIWGAGRVGRWWCREMVDAGIGVTRFIDVDKKKIGGSVGDIPVVGPEEMEKKMPGDLVLGCVGSRGAREKIRDYLVSKGYVETKDFVLIA